jgi:hypothetical protein
MAQIGAADDEEKFASLMNDQNIHYFRRNFESILHPNLGNYKEEVEVSNGRYTLYSPWSCIRFFTKGENPLDVDFDRAKRINR